MENGVVVECARGVGGGLKGGSVRSGSLLRIVFESMQEGPSA